MLTVPPAVSGVQGQEREQQLAQRLKDKLVISGEELRICPYCFETLHRWASSWRWQLTCADVAMCP